MTSAPVPQGSPEREGISGFQEGGTSWSPGRPDIRELLGTAKHVETRSIYYGSNACYLVLLRHEREGSSLAVYKPARGEYPLWDFPAGTLYRREVATYMVDSLLGWGLVPPTVVANGAYGVGSLQLFVEESPRQLIPAESLRRLSLLDWIINNADRKPDHLLAGSDGRLWGIDHGLTFHTELKLRTVLWHFAGEPLTESELSQLAELRTLIDGAAGDPLRQMLTTPEIRALRSRIDTLRGRGRFPDPQLKPVPYRW